MSEELEEKPKRGRKKKDEATAAPAYPNQIRLRDENGLLAGIEYVKTDQGFVDWRKMINEEFIVLNRMAYAKDGVDLILLVEEEFTKLKAEAPENKKLIKLGGFKELGRLRGIQSQRFSLIHRSEDTAVVSCAITFIPNFENPNGLHVESLAAASIENTTGEYAKYLDVIASNRAYIRCIKDALNILTLSEDEIKIDENITVAPARPGSPLDLLQKTCSTHNLKIDDLIVLLQEIGVDIRPEWCTLESLPTSVIATLIPVIKKKVKEKKEEI